VQLSTVVRCIVLPVIHCGMNVHSDSYFKASVKQERPAVADKYARGWQTMLV